MGDKFGFEQAFIDFLKKHDMVFKYDDALIRSIEVKCSVDEVPEVNVSYFLDLREKKTTWRNKIEKALTESD